MSVYGARFDSLAATWQFIENEHDKEHPDRNQCGGVGGCSLMMTAVRLQHEMIDALTEWRPVPSLRRLPAVPDLVEANEQAAAVRALHTVLDVMRCWHAPEESPAVPIFQPEDVRTIVEDAAREIGVTL